MLLAAMALEEEKHPKSTIKSPSLSSALQYRSNAVCWQNLPLVQLEKEKLLQDPSPVLQSREKKEKEKKSEYGAEKLAH